MTRNNTTLAQFNSTDTDSDTTAETATTTELYHPTDEWDQLTESSQIMTIGASRRADLEAIEAKSTLEMHETTADFDSIDDLANSLRELSLCRQNGHLVRSIPTDEIETIRDIFNSLPDDAQSHVLADDTLRSRVNTAKRRFNEWLNQRKRKQEKPGWTEAGPAGYDADEFLRLADKERSLSEHVDEAIDQVRAAVNGGVRQRALTTIGSSIADQTEIREQSQREQMQDQLEAGMIVTYRSPREHVGAVVRVNTKTVTVSRPNPRHPGDCPLTGEPEEPYITSRQDLDSEWLTPIPEDEFEKKYAALEQLTADLSDDYAEAVSQLTEN